MSFQLTSGSTTKFLQTHIQNQTFFPKKTFPETFFQRNKQLKPRSRNTYIDEGRIKEDLCLVVQDINDGLTYPRKPFDGFLDRSSACRACHSENREGRSLGFRRRRTLLHAAALLRRHALAFWVTGHGGIVRPGREIAIAFAAKASQSYQLGSHE